MEHDRDPVRGRVEVELDRVRARRHAELEGGQRVLGGACGVAAVRDDLGGTVEREGGAAQGTAPALCPGTMR